MKSIRVAGTISALDFGSEDRVLTVGTKDGQVLHFDPITLVQQIAESEFNGSHYDAINQVRHSGARKALTVVVDRDIVVEHR